MSWLPFCFSTSFEKLQLASVRTLCVIVAFFVVVVTAVSVEVFEKKKHSKKEQSKFIKKNQQ